MGLNAFWPHKFGFKPLLGFEPMAPIRPQVPASHTHRGIPKMNVQSTDDIRGDQKPRGPP